MEQGLSAITLYCAPAAGPAAAACAMEPEQVSGGRGRRSGLSPSPCRPGRGKREAAAGEGRCPVGRGAALGSGRGQGGGRGLSPSPGGAGTRGPPGFPLWVAEGEEGLAAAGGGRSVSLSVRPSFQRSVITASAAGRRVAGVSCSPADNAADKRA